jgi:hypothetical protein
VYIENSRIIATYGDESKETPAHALRVHWLPALSLEPALFHACVGYTSIQYAAIEGKPKNNSCVAEHIGKAVALIRNQLEVDPIKATSDEMIASVLLLIGAEVNFLPFPLGRY